MPVETILVDGHPVTTLAEYICPGLRGIFVGINPAPPSVAAGHYYQGRLGRRFWDRVRTYNIVRWTHFGSEDDDAVGLGFGFADLVRRPTASAKELRRAELLQGAKDMTRRLSMLPDRPPVVFVLGDAAKHAASLLEAEGFQTYRMPGPYEKAEVAKAALEALALQFRQAVR